MSNETTHFFGAFVDVTVLPVDYELVVHQCASGHTAKTPFCPQCGLPVRELCIAQRRYPADHYELLDDDLADTLTDTTPRDMYGKSHIVLRANIGTDTVWIKVDRYTHSKPLIAFPTDAEQAAMKAALLAFPAVRALQDHPQVASVTAWCGYVEDSEY